ncbi:MAG: excinuclease ABC subunit A [Alphaproteobacteria bacterium CG11_big_fil_rev_8_21_14_0_20_39_49]|nr:MAG: excinuclease ABC subunit A [Alphaproteobacteria bacterium CG11_big_fil_rev_8_21_14_0_20_39_49]
MEEFIKVVGAKEHNLKNISIDIPRNKLVVITGLSGSGKSSLAFDTIYAEGQRRYVESLSAYARQFLQMQGKPDVESISGLSPAIAIDQKTVSRNPRSTVATVTEIYDYMRLLFARIGVPYSPTTGQPIKSQSISEMVDRILTLPEGTKLYILAPFIRGRKGEHSREILELKKQGFTRFMIDGEMHEVTNLPTVDKNKHHNMEVVVDRIAVAEDLGNRLPSSIETSLGISGGILYVDIVSLPKDYKGNYSKGERIVFSEKFACPVSGFTLEEIEPRMFSFNSPYGACTECDGLGTEVFFDPRLIVPHDNIALSKAAIAPWSQANSRQVDQTLHGLAKHYKFDLNTPFKDLPENIKEVIFYGSGEEEITFDYDEGSRSFTLKKTFEGVVNSLNKRWKSTDSSWLREELEKYQDLTKCHACSGHRLKPESLCVKIEGLNIGETANFTISEAVEWFGSLYDKLDETRKAISERILRELNKRLEFLDNVGLNYLTLNRESGTLSGGESQRIRLASQIGSGLSGVLYVLDEPSIGLHQCDNQKLLNTLQGLKNLGNSVIVVEHDEDTMRQADYLIDVGLGAGIHGGNIIAKGTPEEVMKSKESITGQYLSGKKSIPVPEKRRSWSDKKSIKIKGARANNLKNIDVTLPLGAFTCVTGVSGGGKSSLVIQTLYKAVTKKLNGTKVTPGMHDSITGLETIDKIIEIDQSPIGRTPRSNPATYTGAFGPIRDWFTNLPESKARGYKPGRFSFNVKGGRCEVCQGDGLIKIEMHFLPDVYVNCDACHGERYNRETLEVKYKGKSIADVLNMNVEEADIFFAKVPVIKEKMEALKEVGLGYIKLGQSATTLSGGEAQRVKLAKELSKRSTGRTLYILDEPTTGLHAEDIGKLLKVLHKLVDGGNTIIVIEHNLDVIKTADHIVDIGPGGGDKGGNLVGFGTPEEIAANKKSITGEYLKHYLKPKKKSSKEKAA